MDLPYAASLRALVRPGAAFPREAPPLGRAMGAMLAAWAPPVLVNAALTVWQGLQGYGALRQNGLPSWLAERLARGLGGDPEDLGRLLASLPPPPAFGRIWPWLLLAVPLILLGTWLHHAVWDHTGLWLLGGLKGKRGFRASLGAEAEALRITALGALVGLLGFVPGLGLLLAVPLLLLDGYLWIFRGFALAARHGCEPWRGVAATVIHAALLGVCALGLGVTLLALLGAVA